MRDFTEHSHLLGVLEGRGRPRTLAEVESNSYPLLTLPWSKQKISKKETHFCISSYTLTQKFICDLYLVDFYKISWYLLHSSGLQIENKFLLSRNLV